MASSSAAVRGAGVAVGVGVGVGVALGVGVDVDVGVDVAVGVGVTTGTAVDVGVGAGVAVALAVGTGVGEESNRPHATPIAATRTSSPRIPHPLDAALFTLSGVPMCTLHPRIGDMPHSGKVLVAICYPNHYPSMPDGCRRKRHAWRCHPRTCHLYRAVRSIFSTARKASCGTSTFPMRFSLFFPSACFSSSFRFLVTSPP